MTKTSNNGAPPDRASSCGFSPVPMHAGRIYRWNVSGLLTEVKGDWALSIALNIIGEPTSAHLHWTKYPNNVTEVPDKIIVMDF